MPPSDLSGFTHVFRADINTSPRRPRINKRARRPVSCVPCRVRKLKCDRVHPVCGGCERRRDTASCKWDLPPGAVFASPGTVGTADDGAASTGTKKAEKSIAGVPTKGKIQERLQALEEMVNGLIAAGRSPGIHSSPQCVGSGEGPATTTATTQFSPAQVSNTSAHSTGGGRMGHSGAYVGATHWTAILERIHDLQGLVEGEDSVTPDVDVDMGDEQEQHPHAPRHEEPDLLFGAVQPISIQDVMAALPPRLKADQLLTVYDQARFTQNPFIHYKQFKRQYEAFWVSPQTSSLLWVSILFSSLATAVLSEIDAIGEDAAFAQRRFFINKAVQCLISGEYLKAKPFAVEALVFYTLTRLTESKAVSYLWSAIGLAARLAQRMGYHRDTSQIGGRSHITPFQAEMRRRTWYVIEVFDVLFSHQLGMPTIVQPDQCDVDLPRNLHDDDFDEDTAVLPPSRPETEPTRALYYRYKLRLVRHIRHIILHALSVATPDYQETLSLHHELERIHENIPPSLRFVRYRDGGVEMKTVLHNMSLEILYLKGMCILHRPYLTRRKGDPACELSRRTCRQAALRILDLHIDMEVEVKLDAKLFEKGYLLNSLAAQDFLVAAMILCLDLSETANLAQEDKEVEIFALQALYRTWSEKHRSQTNETAHATKVLGGMLRSLPKNCNSNAKPSISSSSSSGSSPQPPITSNLRQILDPIPELPAQPKPTLAMSPGLVRFGNHAMSMGGFPSSEMDLTGLDLGEGTGTGGGMENGWEGVMGMGDVDWNMIDAYCVDREGDIVPQQPLVTATGTSSRGGMTEQQQQQMGIGGTTIIPNSVYSTPYTRSPASLTPRLMTPSGPGGMGFPPRQQQQPTGWRSYGYSVGDLMNP